MVAYTPSNSSQSSVTDTSSLIEASSGQGTEASEPPPPRTNPIAETLRRAYKRISDLEVKCAKEAEAEQRGREDRPDEWTREELAPVEVDGPQRDDRYWLNAIELHKECVRWLFFGPLASRRCTGSPTPITPS